MTVSITMSDEEYNFINSYAKEKNVSLSEFFLTSALQQIEDEEFEKFIEEIEDEESLKLYEKAEAEFNAYPVTYSHEEVKKILGICG